MKKKELLKELLDTDVEELEDEVECGTEEVSGDVKIVVLQRGWTIVGRFEREGSKCKIHNASVIRTWGTTQGLGEIAKGGPTSTTKLDKCNGLVEFDYLTVVLTMACKESAWKKYL